MKFIDIENWSDQECHDFDASGRYFPIRFSRDLLRQYHRVANKYDSLMDNWNNLYEIFKTGKFYGYTIKCPYCGVEYNICHGELNLHQIRCMDCGNWYSQDREIKQLLMRGPVNEET